MDKFNRAYSLHVQVAGGDTLEVELPFTVEFDITRNILTSANVCSIRIYNLSEKNRNQIRKDSWQIDELRLVELRAGYGDNLPIIFAGNISQAWSVREGVNFITSIECYDGGFAFANGNTSVSFPAGTSQQSIIENLMESLPGGVSVGMIGNYPGQISRGNTYTGNTMNILRELTGGGVFIDNSIVNSLGDNECLQGAIDVINSRSGLLGTPVREEHVLNFDILFEPRLAAGQIIILDSITGANFNSAYKVISLKHRGTISESVAGDAITSVGVFAQAALSVVNG